MCTTFPLRAALAVLGASEPVSASLLLYGALLEAGAGVSHKRGFNVAEAVGVLAVPLCRTRNPKKTHTHKHKETVKSMAHTLQ